MKKITFIGDITSDRPLLNAAYDRNTDAYDFSPVFGKVKKLFEVSDYVVGNQIQVMLRPYVRVIRMGSRISICYVTLQMN